MKSFDKIVIGNWKMQLSVKEAEDQALKLKKLLEEYTPYDNIEMVICPDFLSFTEVKEILENTRVSLGAQDGFQEDKGSYTGEESLKHLKQAGCDYVILGHSERRAMGETDKEINNKVKAALDNNLIPIICVGETFDERKDGNKDLIIIHQVYQALQDIEFEKDQTIIIAYEPVWVIGSGQVIDPKEASLTASVINQSVLDIVKNYNDINLKILYGGSVEPGNINKFSSLDNISGVLVGGASLKAKTFIQLIKNI